MLNLPFKRTETQIAATYTLFGKLPNRADFVRFNMNHPVVVEFDAFVQNVFEKMQADAATIDSVELSGPVDFQYVSQDQSCIMIGVLCPSRDSAGRRYPLVAAAILPHDSIAEYLPVSPIAYEVFFDGLREQVLNAIENSVEALSCRQYLEASLRTHDAADEDLQLAQNVVQRFMAQESAGRVASLLAASGHRATLHQALLNIAFYQDYLRRFNSRATNQIILLPLPVSKGEQALMASTWLSILSALWTASENGANWRGSYLILRRPGEQAKLVASVGTIPDSFINVMLGGVVEEGMTLELGTAHDAWKSHRMYAESSYALGRILADPDFRLSMLCGFLDDMSRQLEGHV